MKKIIIYILFICTLFITSCKSNSSNTTNKFLLDGDINATTTVSLTIDDLKYKIDEQDSFVLLIKSSTCTSCHNFSTNILNPYIVETHSIIYDINSVYLDNENFKNKPKYKVTPTIVIYNEGQIIENVGYKSNNNIFKDKDAFKNFMNDYTISPKKISIDEQTLDTKIANNEEFVLFIGWYRCGDCKSLEELVLDDYLKNLNNNQYLYYLESDEYRKNKPANEPIKPDDSATEEIKAQYEEDLQNWNKWIEFAKKYNFDSYRNGRVPALIHYENNKVDDLLIYNNDEINEDGVIINSFIPEIINSKLSSEARQTIHNEKAIIWLNKYFK